MFTCKYCGKEYETPAKLGGHVSRCKQNPHYEESMKQLEEARKHVYKKYKSLSITECECEYCHNYFSIYGIKAHIKACESNPNALPKHLFGNKGKTKGYSPWNKGLTKYTDERVRRQGETYSKHIQDGSIETTGGFREQCVKNYKHGWYQGIYCDSSWELAYILYCLDNDIKIERNTDYLTYIDSDNHVHKFYPDFLIDGSVLVEIKGMQDKFHSLKSEQNPNVRFLYKDDMKPILHYVKSKYGKDFVNLLENTKS